MTQEQVDAAIAAAMAQPKSARTSAGEVVNQDLDKIVEAAKQLRKPNRPPFAVTRAVPSGAVGPRRVTDQTV